MTPEDCGYEPSRPNRASCPKNPLDAESTAAAAAARSKNLQDER